MNFFPDPQGQGSFLLGAPQVVGSVSSNPCTSGVVAASLLPAPGSGETAAVW
ncbi:hypothetical protein C357_09314, partial [Citreicella sp. 357]